MKQSGRIVAIAAFLCSTGLARAGEEPLYQPAPDWVEPAPPIDLDKARTGFPLVRLDMQNRLEDGQVWTLTDMAVRADTPESITQFGTISFDWIPDQGDLLVHQVEILRDGETIDVLKNSKFTILRREQQLERRIMLGNLTGTLTVPGLRVGDILHYTVSVTQRDKALGGKVQAFRMLPADPFTAQFGRVRASWPASAGVRYQSGPASAEIDSRLSRDGAYQVWEATLPVKRQKEIPNLAPPRFAVPPNAQFSDFADWRDVSRTMAPLFASTGLIEPGGDLAAQVKAIKDATTDPVERAAKALGIVQSRIAYMLFGMNGGNYVPQTPEQTWASRLGDCKAKTLLLLAMLDELGVEAEPVLARSVAGDMLPETLPMAAAFDHVLVHARIDGEDYWLDGTDSGTRQPDLRDVPYFRYVLPLQTAGADLTALPARAPARPDMTVDLVLDQSAGVSFPNIVDMAVQTRGAMAARMHTTWLQAPEEQRKNLAHALSTSNSRDIQLAEYSLTYDEETGVALFKGHGIATTSWRMERGRYRQTVSLAMVPFAPDRARAAWQSIPATTGQPRTIAVTTRILLPEGGRGVTLDGQPDIDETIAGARLSRSGKLADGVYSLHEVVQSTGAEIPPERIPDERAKAAAVASRSLVLAAPEDSLRASDFATSPARKKLRAYDEIYARIIKQSPDDAGAYLSRASFLRGILDFKGALADVDKALTLEPDANTHLMRASLLSSMGDKVAAAEAARQATNLEPDHLGALTTLVTLLAESDQQDQALSVIQQHIDNGGKERFNLMAVKADVLAQGGDPEGAVKVLDEAIASRPGDPGLLNARCWIKGTRNLALDTALIDCTKAMQLSDNPAPILDSRAMVYFRLGQLQDALNDIDAALQSAPDLTPSRFMRGIVLKRMGRSEAGQNEIDRAVRINPELLSQYGKYGIVP